jgi:hypothetical protein
VKALVVSFRLGGTDGVSVEADKWCAALRALGWQVVTVAGEGEADHLVPALAMSATGPPLVDELEDLFAEADVVVVENVCSLPLNPPAAAAVVAALDERPTIFHHHDLPWERPAYAGYSADWVPRSPCWRHVCISENARATLRRRGHDAVRIYNAFDPYPRLGDRGHARALIGAAPGELVVMQPTRAIERKNVPGAVGLAERFGATYWLLGDAEDGYGSELDEVLGNAGCRVLRGRFGLSVADAYVACDLVALVSSWEGFGNPAVEAGLHGRAAVVGDYPVAKELARYGFRWFSPGDEAGIGSYLADPDPALPGWNAEVARRDFSTADLPQQIEGVLVSLGCFVDAG